MSKDFKVFLGVISFFVLLKSYIFFNINPSMYLNPMGFDLSSFPKLTNHSVISNLVFPFSLFCMCSMPEKMSSTPIYFS